VIDKQIFFAIKQIDHNQVAYETSMYVRVSSSTSPTGTIGGSTSLILWDNRIYVHIVHVITT